MQSEIKPHDYHPMLQVQTRTHRRPEHEFYRFAGCRRFVWNYALERKIALYKETGKASAMLPLRLNSSNSRSSLKPLS